MKENLFIYLVVIDITKNMKNSALFLPTISSQFKYFLSLPDADNMKPLEGVRILDLTRFVLVYLCFGD